MENSPRFNFKQGYRYDFKRRLEVLDIYRQNGCNAAETSRQLGISPRSIGHWIENEAAICTASKKKGKRLVLTDPVGLFPELETGLLNWLISRRVHCKRSVHIKDLQEQTKTLINKQN